MFQHLLQLLSRLFFFTGYFANGSYPKPLSAEEEAECLAAMKRGSKKAREKLICHNMRLVAHIAKKYGKNDLEDYISIGSIGVIKGVETFSEEKGANLATYLARCIENEILMYRRKLSRRRQEVSLDEPLNVDGEGNELLLADILGTDSDAVYTHMENEVERQLLTEGLRKLSSREKQIIEMRFGIGGTEERTQKEVADMLGISQSYISRLEKKIIQRLRKEIGKLV